MHTLTWYDILDAMENKAIRILSFCLAALFALAVIFFAVGLLVEYKRAPQTIQSTLSQFVSDVEVASEYYTPGTQQFSEVLRARIASNRTIAVVTITKGNDVIFAYPLSSPFITQGVAGQPTITASSSLVSMKSKEVVIGEDSYIISSALYALQPAVIYSYIRISFLVVLAGTLVAGIALMYLYLTEQKKDAAARFDDRKMAQKLKSSKLDFPEVSPPEPLDSLDDDEFDLPEDGDSIGEDELPEGALDFPPAQTDTSDDSSLPSMEDFDEREFLASMIEEDHPQAPQADSTSLAAPQPDPDELDRSVVAQAQFSQEEPSAPPPEPKSSFGIDEALQGIEPPAKDPHEDSPSAEPTGLFSPTTGFGWESYLEERLDSELMRSASAEEDIGLMIIRIPGLDRENAGCRAICDQLLEFYKFKDLIFEYGEDGFSCIVHSINVDGALSLAERVYVAVSRVLEENGMDNEIGIGISTRSFRLVPAKRIFMEAEQALRHAFEDPETAIVAFRVDPEKYRKYISEQDDS